MPGPRFCRLVPLLPAYGGAVAHALGALAAPVQDPNLLPVPAPGEPLRADPLPISPAVAMMGPHADLFDFATTGGGGDD